VKTKTKYFLVSVFDVNNSVMNEFETEQEAVTEAQAVLENNDDGVAFYLFAGTASIPLVVNRKPTVAIGTPAKATRKPRKKTSTAAVADGDTLAVMKVNKDGGVRRKPGRPKTVKPPESVNGVVEAST
jgi:hypothetical protein